MIRASELKNGMVVSIDGVTLVVKGVTVKSPSSRSATTLYKIVYRNVVTKQKVDAQYKGDDMLQPVEFQRRSVQFLFKDGDFCTFMDNEDYNQYTINSEMIEDELLYLTDTLEGVYALIADDVFLGIQLPSSVDLEIIDTTPEMKGSSATARTKPATLSTGLVVQIPEYLAIGEVIKVNTELGKFISRA